MHITGMVQHEQRSHTRIRDAALLPPGTPGFTVSFFFFRRKERAAGLPEIADSFLYVLRFHLEVLCQTGNAIIIAAALALVVLVGIVAAEDFMMPQEIEVKESVNLTNSTNNTTHAENVKRHVPPRGVMQKAVLSFFY